MTYVIQYLYPSLDNPKFGQNAQVWTLFLKNVKSPNYPSLDKCPSMDIFCEVKKFSRLIFLFSVTL